jgi:hypothetical protein
MCTLFGKACIYRCFGVFLLWNGFLVTKLATNKRPCSVLISKITSLVYLLWVFF